MDLEAGDQVRFFVRSGGCADVSHSFSIGVTLEDNAHPFSLEKVDNITFYIAQADQWFFEGKELNVKYQRKNNEVVYHLNEN